MREIQKIAKEELLQFAKISVNAYPSMKRPPEELAKKYEELISLDAKSNFYGIYDGDLVGGMRLLDLDLAYLGKIIPAGGLGSVAVDLTKKKQGIARDLVRYFLNHYREQGTYLALLYPFRPDFYKDMGFGYGSKMHKYSFKPDSLSGKAYGVTYLTEDDMAEVENFYTEYTRQQHGFCLKSKWDLKYLQEEYISKRHMVGYRENGVLKGYITFYFDLGDNVLDNNLVLDEWLWLNSNALGALSGFLRTQADQFNRIIYSTQNSNFHYLLNDVRDGSNRMIPSIYHESNTSGVGLMYRIISVRDFLEQTNYREYTGTLNLTISVRDTFVPDNAGEYYLSFNDGKLTLTDKPLNGHWLEIDIADLSSLLMGSVELKTLWRLGRVYLEGDIKELNQLFLIDRPECVTHF